jgi:uridine kinase
METLLGLRGAFVDRIYYCPHHPDSGFEGERVELKVACDCRKPKTGMIDFALKEFNGARERSWMIGDTSVDIETAKRSGLKSILVETGYAGLDYREWAMPDAIVPDLASAVEFILDQYPRWFTYCEQLAKDIGAGSIVLIGGQARCGKSTFANVLRDVIQASGKRAWVLSTDRWLRGEQEREVGVLGRYDMAALQSLADEFGNEDRQPVTLSLPGYNKLKRTRTECVDKIVVSSSDVILIEGTVALALKTSNDIGTCRFQMEIDEESRKQRVLNEYRLRGHSEAQALEVYLARQADEFPVIESLARGALSVSVSDIPA